MPIQIITILTIFAIPSAMYFILRTYGPPSPRKQSAENCSDCELLREVAEFRKASQNLVTIETHRQSEGAVRRWVSHQFISKEKYENDKNLKQAATGYFSDIQTTEFWLAGRDRPSVVTQSKLKGGTIHERN